MYDAGPIKGVTFERLLTEELVVVAPFGTGLAGESGSDISLPEIAELPLLLPGRMHTIRKVVEQAFDRAEQQPNVVAEVESVMTLSEAVRTGLGATVLPWSVARRVMDVEALELRRIEPGIEVHVSLGTPANQPPLQTGRGGARCSAHRRCRLREGNQRERSVARRRIDHGGEVLTCGESGDVGCNVICQDAGERRSRVGDVWT